VYKNIYFTKKVENKIMMVKKMNSNQIRKKEGKTIQSDAYIPVDEVRSGMYLRGVSILCRPFRPGYVFIA
jgi:hypothetical protein